jgi:hypothetical protein
MSRFRLVPIVEGHGETAAVPLLLRRLGRALDRYDVDVAPPLRCPRSRLVKPGELERAVTLASRKTRPPGGILILVDAEDDCPKSAALDILARARAARSDIPLSVVLATREYEAWFLASIESLRGNRGIRPDASFPGDPEEIRGAKERLESLMEPGAAYSETLDQPALTDVFDVALARRRAPSFDKLCREFERLLREMERQVS